MDVREKATNEKRLIDANRLKEAVTTDYYEHFTRCHDTDQIALIDMVCDDIEEALTVDAVEVVRCKNCKHRYKDSWCEYVDDDDNFYCARGEWKDGAD